MNSINENNCSICIEPLKSSKSKQLNCNHEFHLNCIQNWYSVQQNCPICRHLITPNEVNIDKPCCVEIISDYTSLPSSYQNIIQITSQTNNNSNMITYQETKSNYKSLKIIINLFVFIGIVSSFTANIFCQNNFITEIKNYIEYMNNNTLDIDINFTIIDNNVTMIDSNITMIDSNFTMIKNISSDSFYIVCAIIYMCFMLILTINYIGKLNMESYQSYTHHYIGFYIMTIIMFCTHLYYILDVLSYMNETKYPNFTEFGDIKHLYHTYLITSMTSLAILIFSFLNKIIENVGLTVSCFCNMLCFK
jgi:hypothetical protein